MEKLLSNRMEALSHAVWPIGEPKQRREIPLWQAICAEWQDNRMRPTNVTHLIDELIESSDPDDTETTACDIRAAVDAAADWENAAEKHGWESCDDLIDELSNPMPWRDGRDVLVELLTLAFTGEASKEMLAADDFKFFWVRSTPTWEAGQLGETVELLDWVDMTDTYIEHRLNCDAVVEKATSEKPSYRLCHVHESHEGPLRFRDSVTGVNAYLSPYLTIEDMAALPSGVFIGMAQMIETCRHAVTAWVISEWLETNTYVNLTDENEWSCETDYKTICEHYGYDVAPIEVFQWFVVSEVAGEHLREVGGVVVPLVGTCNFLYGRQQCGQALHFDGEVQNAMIRSGYLNHIPPLGALNSNERILPPLRITLGGETYPLRIYGFSEFRTDAELDDVIIDPFYRELGWVVTWGPSYSSETEGMIRTFKIGLPAVD